jgi:hypothetical protein
LAANCQLIFCGNQTGGSNDWSILTLTPTIEWFYNSKNTKNIWIKTCSSKHVKLLKTPTKKKQALAVRPSKCGRHCRLRRELQHQADDGNEGHLPGALCITDFWGVYHDC